MIDVVLWCLGRSVAQADRLSPEVSLLHLSDELGELLQWQCHDDSIINIVVAITISIRL